MKTGTIIGTAHGHIHRVRDDGKQIILCGHTPISLVYGRISADAPDPYHAALGLRGVHPDLLCPHCFTT